MNSANKEITPARYIIRVKNHLDSHWEHWFDGMTITHIADGVTMLSGVVVDQSALYGILEKVHTLNLTLIFVEKVDTDEVKSQK